MCCNAPSWRSKPRRASRRSLAFTSVRSCAALRWSKKSRSTIGLIAEAASSSNASTRSRLRRRSTSAAHGICQRRMATPTITPRSLPELLPSRVSEAIARKRLVTAVSPTDSTHSTRPVSSRTHKEASTAGERANSIEIWMSSATSGGNSSSCGLRKATVKSCTETSCGSTSRTRASAAVTSRASRGRQERSTPMATNRSAANVSRMVSDGRPLASARRRARSRAARTLERTRSSSVRRPNARSMTSRSSRSECSVRETRTRCSASAIRSEAKQASAAGFGSTPSGAAVREGSGSAVILAAPPFIPRTKCRSVNRERQWARRPIFCSRNERLKEQQDYDRAGRQERAEWDRTLPRRRPFSEQKDRGEDAGRQGSQKERACRTPAERGADQERKLDVAHAEPGGIGEEHHEEEETGTEAGHQPLPPLVRMQDQMSEQNPDPGRNDDAVGDDVTLEVVTRDDHQDRNHGHHDQRLRLNAVADRTEQREERGDSVRRSCDDLPAAAFVPRLHGHGVRAQSDWRPCPASRAAWVGGMRWRAAASIASTRRSIGVHFSTTGKPFQRPSAPSQTSSTAGETSDACSAVMARPAVTREAPASSSTTTSARWRSAASTTSSARASLMS